MYIICIYVYTLYILMYIHYTYLCIYTIHTYVYIYIQYRKFKYKSGEMPSVETSLLNVSDWMRDQEMIESRNLKPTDVMPDVFQSQSCSCNLSQVVRSGLTMTHQSEIFVIGRGGAVGHKIIVTTLALVKKKNHAAI